MEINLKQYRPWNSTSYSGRPQGESVRKELNLSKADKDESDVTIIIPADTTSFNPSFFLGLLYDSIQKLGVDGFNKKYHLKIEATNETLRNAITRNIEDGMRNANNSLNNRTAFNVF